MSVIAYTMAVKRLMVFPCDQSIKSNKLKDLEPFLKAMYRKA